MKCFNCILAVFLFFGFSNKIYGLYDYSVLVNKHVKNQSALFKKKYGFELQGSGGTGGDVRDISAMYFCQKEVSINEAREIFIDCCESFIRVCNNDKEIRPYLHDFPFTDKNVSLNLGFTSKTDKWATNGFVAGVNAANGIIYYDKYNPSNRRLEDLYKESYEEALRIVQEGQNQQSRN